jgi:hypothetical protein
MTIKDAAGGCRRRDCSYPLYIMPAHFCLAAKQALFGIAMINCLIFQSQKLKMTTNSQHGKTAP